ncbi:hypothetical protein pb186bvf_000538 [Paramecium bursaria]
MIPHLTINVNYLGNKSIKLQIEKTVPFIDIATTMFSLGDYKKKQSQRYAFVLRNQIIQGEDLQKQFQQYSNKNEELILFLVDLELTDYINNNSDLFPPPVQSTQINQTLPAIKIEIIVKRKQETFSLSLDDDQIHLLDLYEYLTDSQTVRKTQTAAFLHQLSAAFYDFNNFQAKLCDMMNQQINLDLNNKLQVQPQANDKQQQGQPTQPIQIPQVQNGITINVLSEDGPSRRNFQFVNMSPELTVVELKQLVSQYLGYNNPYVVDVDLFKQDGFQLNGDNKQNRSLSDLNLASKEISIVAKTRWIGGSDL